MASPCPHWHVQFVALLVFGLDELYQMRIPRNYLLLTFRTKLLLMASALTRLPSITAQSLLFLAVIAFQYLRAAVKAPPYLWHDGKQQHLTVDEIPVRRAITDGATTLTSPVCLMYFCLDDLPVWFPTPSKRKSGERILASEMLSRTTGRTHSLQLSYGDQRNSQ